MKFLLLVFFLFDSQYSFSQTQDSLLTITVTGDVMLDRNVRKSIGDKSALFLFDNVDSIFNKSDFTIINMESAVTDTGSATRKKYKFKADSKWLKDLKALGITHLDVANNHSFDYKMDGFQRTVKNIKENNLEILGIRDSINSPIKISRISKNGNELAVLAASLFKLEADVTSDSLPIPAVSFISSISAQVRSFKKENPLIPILVLLHWGIEYEKIPSEKQQKEAQMMIDFGADLVIIHHPHILQQIDFYKGKPIFYSLGNFVFDQRDANTKESMFVTLEFKENQLKRFRVYPIRLKSFIPTPVSLQNATFMVPIMKNISEKAVKKNGFYEVTVNNPK